MFGHIYAILAEHKCIIKNDGSISENHILEDVNKCVLALQEGDGVSLDRVAGAIRGRAARVAAVVTSEMDNYEPGIYTERVLEAVQVVHEWIT